MNLYAIQQRHTGIGAEVFFTGSLPIGGGAGLSMRTTKIPLTVTVSGAYLYGRHGSVKAAADYWFLAEKITDVNQSTSFHWFAGIGMFADMVCYSVPTASGTTGYRTTVGGGFGIRMPIGCYFYAGQEKYEPYLQCSPEFGMRIYPKDFIKRMSVLWSFPVSFGCRFWF